MPNWLERPIAAFLLVILSPVMALIAVAVRRETGPPALYRQERVGRFGRSFTLLKFRSMSQTSSPGPQVTSSTDARITRIGAILRSTKADELPQLINVIRGDMSLVGPRPEVRKYALLWPPALRPQILSVRPGITDPVSVSLRREEQLLSSKDSPETFYVEHLLPRKALGYARYVENRSFALDLAVLWQTLKSVLRD